MDRRDQRHAPLLGQAGSGKAQAKDDGGRRQMRAPADGMAANGEQGPGFVSAPGEEQRGREDTEVRRRGVEIIQAKRSRALEAFGGNPKGKTQFSRSFALKNVKQSGENKGADGKT